MKVIGFVLSFLLLHTFSPDQKPAVNDYVGVEISVKQKKLKAGTAGDVLISLKPKKGIHITADPPFSLSLDTLKQFFSSGKPDFKKDDKGYVNTESAIRQEILVAKTTPVGSYKLKTTFIYYYCSDEEGWCSRFKQPLELSVTVVK